MARKKLRLPHRLPPLLRLRLPPLRLPPLLRLLALLLPLRPQTLLPKLPRRQPKLLLLRRSNFFFAQSDTKKPPSGGFFHGLRGRCLVTRPAGAGSVHHQPVAGTGRSGDFDVVGAGTQRLCNGLLRQLGQVVLLAQVGGHHVA